MTWRRLTVGVAAALTALVAGCGSSTSTTASSGGATSSSASSTGSGGTEAGKSADQVLNDTRAAIRSAHSYHLVYTQVDATGTTTQFDLSVAGAAQVSGSLVLGGSKLDLVVLGGSAYVHGKAFFAQIAGAAAAAAIGDSWVLLSAAQAAQFNGILGLFADTGKLGECLLSSTQHGTLTVSEATYSGVTVAEIKDAGDVPGDAPALLDVANSGPTYPLRYQILGARVPGGPPTPAACQPPSPPASPAATTSATSGSGTATAVFDDWNGTFTVTPPPNPIDLSKLGG